jgi:PPM family protein phosphatase
MTGSGERAASASHIGGRDEQQDAVACFASGDGRSHLLVVADGMGGHQGGALAAGIVIGVAEQLWGNRDKAPDNPHTFLETLCQQAHETIRQKGSELGLTPLSTVAALLTTPNRAWWVHVGDSRVYGFRDGTLVLRTEDHTVVRKLVRTGQLGEAEHQGHPEQHKLLRGLGGDDTLRTSHGQMAMTPNTGFVICSDGFWNVMASEELAEMLNSKEAMATCMRSAAVAAERGGVEGDNVTVAILLPDGTTGNPPLTKYWPLYGAAAVALLLLLTQALR